MGGNNCFIFGNVGKDPVVKEVGQKGTLVAEFSVATNRPNLKVTGEFITEWHNIKAWGKAAEYVQAFVLKGHKVAIHGESMTEEWPDKNNPGKNKYRTVIVVNWPGSIVASERGAKREDAPSQGNGAPADDQDLPF